MVITTMQMAKTSSRSEIGTKLLVVLGLLAALAGVSTVEATERRAALVIGINEYPIVGNLINARKDALDVATKLENLGFEVTRAIDVRRRDFGRALTDFANKSRGYDVVLVYYAGHGVNVEGQNWFIPSQANLEYVEDLQYEAISQTHLMSRVLSLDAKLSIFIIDACRDNPLQQKTRGINRGLSTESAEKGGKGMVIMYSAAKGQVALDGPANGNGIFTGALLEALDETGLSIEETFTMAAKRVNELTDGAQNPWFSSNFRVDFAFGQAAPEPAPPEPQAKEREAPVATGGDRKVSETFTQVEMIFWRSIENGGTESDYALYLQKYPEGFFREIAELRLQQFVPSPEPKPENPADPTLKPSAEEQRLAAMSTAAAVERTETTRLAALEAERRAAARQAERDATQAAERREAERREAERQAALAAERKEAERLAALEAERQKAERRAAEATAAAAAAERKEAERVAAEREAERQAVAAAELEAERKEAERQNNLRIAALTPEPAPKKKVPEALSFEAGTGFRDCEGARVARLGQQVHGLFCGPEMIVVPAGSFLMGAPDTDNDRFDDEGPQHEVTLRYELAVGKFEVSQAEWLQIMGENPSEFSAPHNPVENVSWHDANAFLDALNIRLGLSGRIAYRLLSEAEWEYAARAGSTDRYSFGTSEAELCTHANGAGQESPYDWRNEKCADIFANTSPVGIFQANGFGLHDMHGNVWEWVQDCFHDSYADAPVDGTARASDGCSLRVLRGASWYNDARNLRSSARFKDSAGYSDSIYGFRVARRLN